MHKPYVHKWLVLTLCIALSLFSCSKSWTKIITDGSIDQTQFIDSLEVDNMIGLMIVSVEIKGKKYRFLFDSGAPTSISTDLQNELGFNLISKGKLSDSDNNISKFGFVRIDSLFIASIPFYDQTAFVGDFSANPTLACLDLDGIVGSNTQRFCNWKILRKSKKIYLSSELFENDSIEYSTIPFTSDNQFDINIDLSTPIGLIKHMKVDYGSNGEIGISSSMFDKMLEKEMIVKVYNETGYSQSGIVGKLIEKNRRISLIDSLLIGDHLVEKVMVKSGSNGLIGNRFLSRQDIIIDWTHKQLHIKRNSEAVENGTFGLGFAQSDSLGLIIKSIISEGPADKAGLKPMMKILNYGDLDFEGEHNICDYISKQDQIKDSIQISVMGINGIPSSYSLHKQKLFN